MVTKPTKAKKEAAPKPPRKPRGSAKKPEVIAEAVAHVEAAPEETVVHHKPTNHPAKGRYIFATGRRKTAVANVRLFAGPGNSEVNKKPFATYFDYAYFQDEILKPLERTGLEKEYHFISHINGGGMHAQAGALRHGIATALSHLSPEIRAVLKKNGFLTRDDRKKERKKPGLKRARRSPQWAKR